MTKRLLLRDQPTYRISTTCNQLMQRPIGALCYHNLLQHYYYFAVHKVKLKMNLPSALGLGGELTQLHSKSFGAKSLHIPCPPLFTLTVFLEKGINCCSLDHFWFLTIQARTDTRYVNVRCPSACTSIFCSGASKGHIRTIERQLAFQKLFWGGGGSGKWGESVEISKSIFVTITVRSYLCTRYMRKQNLACYQLLYSTRFRTGMDLQMNLSNRKLASYLETGMEQIKYLKTEFLLNNI
jgi:hypothetical protein